MRVSHETPAPTRCLSPSRRVGLAVGDAGDFGTGSGPRYPGVGQAMKDRSLRAA